MAAAAGKKRRCPSRVEAEFEVHRNIKRAELTAFSCLLNRVIGPMKVYVDIKGIIVGPRRGERECVKPTAGDADLWIKICEELHDLAERTFWWKCNM